MLQYKELFLYFLIMILAFPAFARDNSVLTDGNDSVLGNLSQDETILFNMINDMRRQNKLPSIPLSLNLCKVAQTHIADVIKWKPQDKGCSLHSWSGSGKWTSCCNTKEVFGIQCMKSKPREITGYPGDGYELIYWGEDNATPAGAAELWNQVEASSDMILSRAKWSGYQWKALGVGLKDGYAVLWLGDAEDINAVDKTNESIAVVKQPPVKVAVIDKSPPKEKERVKPKPAVKQNDAAVNLENIRQTVGVPGVRFYVIVGSYKEFEAANSVLKEVKMKGYSSAFIIHLEPLYRISINSFETSEQASKMKNELKETFPGIWVFKK